MNFSKNIDTISFLQYTSINQGGIILKGGIWNMFNLLLSALCWNAFKATPESPAKRRRYHLATNFARK